MFVLTAENINIIAVLKNKLPKKIKYISIYYLSEIHAELLYLKKFSYGWGCAINNFEPCQILAEAALRIWRCAAFLSLSS